MSPLHEQQLAALDLVMAGHNVLILGTAGTGKLFLVREIVKQSQEKGIQVALTCTTGIACAVYSNLSKTLRAQTIHQWSGIDDGRFAPSEIKNVLKNNVEHSKTVETIKRTDLLIIDECSMISKKMFNSLAEVCSIKNENMNFGGIQLVLVGDFHQLPPVPNLLCNDDGDFCFNSKIFDSVITHRVTMTSVMRQTEDILIKAVQEVSLGKLSDETKVFIETLKRPLPDGEANIKLFSTNDRVDDFNRDRILDFPGPLYEFVASDSGDKKYLSHILAPHILWLKKGAPVKLLRNLSDKLFNGLRGEVYDIVDGGAIIEFPSVGLKIPVQKMKFSVFSCRQNKDIAFREQLPLKLAFALTIHKSQGMTLDRVEIDCNRVFKPGQLGVAIGRARTIKGLRVLNFNCKACMPHPESIEYFLNIPGQEPLSDMSCCQTAISTCKGIQYIPDVVKASPTNKDITDLETRINQLLTRLDEMKHEKQDCLNKLRKVKDDILKEIRNLLNDLLDKMEKRLMNDVESRVAGKIQSVNQYLETVNNIASSIEKRRKTVQKTKNTIEAEIFVQIKQGNEHLREQEQNLKLLSDEYEMRSIRLIPGRIEDVLTDDTDNIFGRISEILIPKSIEDIGDFTVRLHSDTNTCFIVDICCTSSGFIVCIDLNNNNLKKLDGYYAVTEHLDMSGIPFSLCELDNTQLAVTLKNDKKVQFVSQQPFKLGRWFNVGDRCRGIDCHDGQLYVCCGGKETENEGPGHIEVYDINGNLLKIFYEGLSLPIYIKAVGKGNFVLSDGLVSKLHNVNINFRLSEILIKTIPDLSAFCKIGDGQLCVTGYDSNNTVLIFEDGRQQQQQELLTKDNGILRPWAVCFDEKQSRLIISLHNSDAVKVFHIVT